MKAFSVHLNPAARHEDDRVVVVKEGFCWPALFIPALWLLYHRMWWVLLGAFVLSLALAALTAPFAGTAAATIPSLMINVMLGFEGNGLRRWSLSRKGYRPAGIVYGQSLVDAERQWFATHEAPSALGSAGEVPPPAPGSGPPPHGSGPWRTAPEARPVLGLFPEPRKG